MEEDKPKCGPEACNGGECPRGKMHCYDWLADIPADHSRQNIVEVQFKNTRKGYYLNSTNLDIAIGDYVAVEATPGHDIGQVTLTGRLVPLQMKRNGVKRDAEIKRVFRRAKPGDMEKFREAKAREDDTMVRARRIAEELKLNMKIGDVEYQGDGNKAIFYYIADERVDFRQLIKVLADTFKVRIEMKQIGARQEAGRIGGIGPCGRPLCCASWMSNFVSVGTAAARFQDISLNPQKLAGQCAKLKCCLNFEVDSYVESLKKLPGKEIRLETADATWFFFKYDIFKGMITYSSDKNLAANLTTIDARRAFEIIAMNKAGQKPTQLQRDSEVEEAKDKTFNDILDRDGLTRFDKAKKKKKKKNGQKGSGAQQQQQEKQQPDKGPSAPPTADGAEPPRPQQRPKGQRPDAAAEGADPQQPQRRQNGRNDRQRRQGQKGSGDRQQQPRQEGRRQQQQQQQEKQPEKPDGGDSAAKPTEKPQDQ